MAARRFDWKKHIRIGGFLFVFVMFAPVLAIFLSQSLALISKRGPVQGGVSVDPRGQMMDGSGMMATGMERRRMWRDTSDAVPMFKDTLTFPSSGTTIPVSATERKVVGSASLDLRAQSVVWTNNRIQDSVKNVGGYVENVSLSQPKNDIRTAWLEVRVPTDRLDTVIDEAKKAAASVVSEDRNIQDATDQSIDLNARLNAKRAEESALVSLLNKAEKVSDVIEVTERLSMVRSEIEQLDAQNRRLEGQVAMASLTISITEDPRVIVDADGVRDGNVVKRSVTDLTRWSIALVSALAAIAISGVPVLMVYGFFIWLFYRLGVFIARRVVGK